MLRWTIRRGSVRRWQRTARIMDHYEELGVNRTASIEEIRQSYKRLVRLLHPDHCRDAAARRLAEIQTKRLNCLLAVLTHQERRQEYDRSLEARPPQPMIPWRPKRTGAPEWFWPALGLILLVNLAYLSAPENARTEAAPAPSLSTTPPQESTVTSRARKRKRTEKVTVGRKETRPPPLPSRRAFPDLILPEPPSAGELLPAASTLRLPLALPPPRFSGNWFFLPSAHDQKPGLYPPEFIELHLTEDATGLYGTYRARYRVSDQAISPAVSFDFSGPPPQGTEAILGWRGPGGATGEVTLQLKGCRALDISWTAHRAGDLDLISGKAGLIRREQPGSPGCGAP